MEVLVMAVLVTIVSDAGHQCYKSGSVKSV